MKHRIFGLVLSMLTALLLNACGGGGGGGFANETGSSAGGSTERVAANIQLLARGNDSTAVADGTDSITLDVTVTDSSNQPVQGVTVEIVSIIDPEIGDPPDNPADEVTVPLQDVADGSALSGITNASGKVEFAVISSEATEFGVRAIVRATPDDIFSDRLDLIFSPRSIGAITIEADRTSIARNSIDSTLITATVFDLSGEAVAGVPVTFSTDLGSIFNAGGVVPLSPAVVNSDADGVAQVRLQSDLASTDLPGDVDATITATGGAQLLSENAVVKFRVPANVTLSASPDVLSANQDGVDRSTLTAEVTGADGIALPGFEVTFSKSGDETQGVLIDANAQGEVVTTTNSNGRATALLEAPSQPGQTLVSAAVDPIFGVESDDVTVNFVTAAISEIRVTLVPDSVVANANFAVEVRLLDPSGELILAEREVVIQMTFAGQSAEQGRLDTFTFANGVYTFNAIADKGPSSTEPLDLDITALVAGLTSAPQTLDVLPLEDAPAGFTIRRDGVSVNSDNIDSVTVTVTVKDADNAVDPGVPVRFSVSDAGQINVSEAVTDANGEASVRVTSGDGERGYRERSITLTSTVPSLTPPNSRAVSVRVIGSQLSFNASSTNLALGDGSQSNVTITALNGAGVGVEGAAIEITELSPAGSEKLLLFDLDSGEPPAAIGATLITDAAGQVSFGVDPIAAGNATLRIGGLGLIHEEEFSVAPPEQAFRISEVASGPLDGAATTLWPEATNPGSSIPELFQVQTGDGEGTLNSVTFTVNIPAGDEGQARRLEFVTTHGSWAESGGVIFEQDIDSAGGEFTARLLARSAVDSTVVAGGTATIEIRTIPVDSGSGITSIPRIQSRVFFFRPPQDAAVITLDSTRSSLRTSIGEEVNEATLSAEVQSDDEQRLPNVWVSFRIVNPTGGGEYLTQAAVQTDSDGVARTQFASGTAPSDAKGVEIEAKVIGRDDLADTFPIVLRREGGGVSLTHAREFTVNAEDTAFILPISVQVTDVNGNAVQGAPVSLDLWPVKFRTGYVLPDADEDQDAIVFTGEFFNEDVDENLFRDGNIDIAVPFREDQNLNGVLDVNEDLNFNCVFDPGEDLNGNGEFDVIWGEDLNRDCQFDRGEDLNGNGRLDTEDTGIKDSFGNVLFGENNGDLDSEDVNGNGVLDFEDVNGNGVLDEGEDLNGNGVLDFEDVNGNGEIDTEDNGIVGLPGTEGNGQLDSEDADRDGLLDVVEDLNLNGLFDRGGSEDINGNGQLDFIEIFVPSGFAAVDFAGASGYTFITYDLNGNGIFGDFRPDDSPLLPSVADAGALPESGLVITDEFGIGSTTLTYLVRNAPWIVVRLRATTEVQGELLSTTFEFLLPIEEGREDDVFDSPFNP